MDRGLRRVMSLIALSVVLAACSSTQDAATTPEEETPAPNPSPTPPPPTGDNSAPSPPSGVAAAAMSSSQVNVTWSSSTDNVGVSGYRVYRCQGTGCSPSAQFADRKRFLYC
jgi:hypothetical protein